MHATDPATRQRTHAGLVLVAIVALVLAAATAAADQARFKSPQLAMRALAEAAAKDNVGRLKEIFGPDGDAIISSGDPVEDAAARRRFVAVARERTTFEPLGAGTVVAHLGREDWPFPVPIVKDGDGWRFDTAAGKDELLNRRIGRNELRTIESCRAYVDAQHDYARVDRTGGGARAYAQRLFSQEGKHDGLYWDDASGKDESPLGPLFAEASSEGYALGQGTGQPQPFHGYLYRILTAQGPNAPGGARSYLKDGQMTRGFALVAYPAEYGKSGIMTFVVNQQGVVFQKDLGEKTAEVGKAMTAYDPDESWSPSN